MDLFDLHVRHGLRRLSRPVAPTIAPPTSCADRRCNRSTRRSPRVSVAADRSAQPLRRRRLVAPTITPRLSAALQSISCADHRRDRPARRLPCVCYCRPVGATFAVSPTFALTISPSIHGIMRTTCRLANFNKFSHAC